MRYSRTFSAGIYLYVYFLLLRLPTFGVCMYILVENVGKRAVFCLCSKYCCIIIDEAHERSVNIDLLLGLLSRIVLLRRRRFKKGEDTLPPLKSVFAAAAAAAAANAAASAPAIGAAAVVAADLVE